MTANVINHLNRSIRQIDQNMQTVKELDFDIDNIRRNTFIKNSKSIAESNTRIWDRIANAHKNKK